MAATKLPLPRSTPTFDAPAHWRAIDFISDLHLAEGLPAVFAAWAAHLRHTRADAVFILGDLFEVWLGDDMAERGFEARAVAVLREAAAAKAIAFMPGNRDFLVGDAMLASSGVERLADPTILAAFGERILLSHGDALCLDDVGYQRYRAVVRRPAVQRAFTTLPLSVRRTVGRALRGRGTARSRLDQHSFIDADADAVGEWTRTAGASALVHGHTHRPATHVVGAGVSRHVLTDWELDDSSARRAEVLRWTSAGFARVAPEGAGAS